MPPPIEPFSGNSLDQTLVWILADDKGERTTGAAGAHYPRYVLRSKTRPPASHSEDFPSENMAR
jgi:hypothetical protein